MAKQKYDKVNKQFKISIFHFLIFTPIILFIVLFAIFAIRLLSSPYGSDFFTLIKTYYSMKSDQESAQRNTKPGEFATFRSEQFGFQIGYDPRMYGSPFMDHIETLNSYTISFQRPFNTDSFCMDYFSIEIYDKSTKEALDTWLKSTLHAYTQDQIEYANTTVNSYPAIQAVQYTEFGKSPNHKPGDQENLTATYYFVENKGHVFSILYSDAGHEQFTQEECNTNKAILDRMVQTFTLN